MPDSLPTGIYDRVVDLQLADALARLPPGVQEELRDIDPAELPTRVAEVAAKWIADTLENTSRSSRADETVRLLGRLGHLLQTQGPAEGITAPIRALKSIAEVDPTGKPRTIPRPVSPLGDTFLLTNARSEPSVGHELESEIGSADRIDVIMAFIRWSGIRMLLPTLRAHVEGGRMLRVLTTCYTGSTELRALEELQRIGADIRVSYDTSTTRLHAKAWLFTRNSGYSTAYVGSSNLTMSAQITGVEWNVRASEASSASVIEKFLTAFETYWADPAYELFETGRFQSAIASASGGSGSAVDEIDGELQHLVAIRPYPFQRTMLERLALERERGRMRNLVVAATGTGKTVVAALDYLALRQAALRGANEADDADDADNVSARGSRSRSRLLFVAHRKEILHQSRNMFRHVLTDGAFGELWVDGHRPDAWDHVFASIQSLSVGDVRNLPDDHFDVVIVDEFHHAAANTYDELLSYLKPRYLLGLTATPERADNRDILGHFGGRTAVELRLWDALEQGLLVPFHYFGIHDGTDLSGLPWKRGYSPSDLESVYTADHFWASKVLQATRERVSDIHKMRALCFCAGVKHAHFMADYFGRSGLETRALDGSSPAGERREALRHLREGKLQAVFAVDLFNEGLDIPGIDTVLMLRPTESATVFLQQLGRGLRRMDGKEVLTVLDFVGHQHQSFRFDQRFRKLLGRSRTEIIEDIETGFPYLPAGSRIHLDREAREIVLRNVRDSLPTTWPRRVAELRQLGDVSLTTYLKHTGLDLTDVYYGNHSWTDLRIAAGLVDDFVGDDAATQDLYAAALIRGIGRLLHVDDMERIDNWARLLARDSPPATADLSERERRLLHMLTLVVLSPHKKDVFPTLDNALGLLWSGAGVATPIRDELLQLFDILAEQRTHRQSATGLAADIPLRLHASYSRHEAFAAVGAIDITNPGSQREGVFFDRDNNLDMLFVTLQKTEKDFSPLTRYRDYAISDQLFHWESQHSTTADSPTGRRYVGQRNSDTNVVLFARETKSTPDRRTAPFFCCGLADYVSHRSSAPIQITWRLRAPLPGDVFAAYRAAVA